MTPKSGHSEFPDRDPQMFYELARERHAAQADTLSVLDNKLIFYLSSSSALVAILIAVYALRPDAFDTWELVLPGASGLAWLLLMALALKALHVKKWLSGPKLDQVFERHFSEEDDATLKWRVAKGFWKDYEKNGKLEADKRWALNRALVLFILQTAILVTALFLVALSHDSDTSRHCRSPLRVAQAQALSLAARKCRVDPASPGRLRSSAQDLTP
jgi:uncharacterized membrane protein